MYLSTSKMTPPQYKMSAKENYFTIHFIHLKHKACQGLSAFTNQYHCVCIHIQCRHLPYTRSLHYRPHYCHSTTYRQSCPLQWTCSTP